MTQAAQSTVSLASLSAAFDRAAAQRASITTRSYLLGGKPVSLQFASEKLEQRLTRAFSHLQIPPQREAALTIRVWESAAGGLEDPPALGEGAEPGPGRAEAYFHLRGTEFEAVYQSGLRALSVYAAPRREAWYWISDAEDVSYLESAKPLRLVLNWWLGDVGLQIVHGGAVATADGGALFIGRSGSGKSTITLAGLEAGLAYAGDDYVAVELSPAPYVHSVYGAGKLEENHAQRFPELAARGESGVSGGPEKVVLYVHEHFPEQVVHGFPLRALVIPRITAADGPTFREASRTAALAALAPSTVFAFAGRGQESLSTMTRLVELVPAFELDLGRDVRKIPNAVRALLEELGERS